MIRKLVMSALVTAITLSGVATSGLQQALAKSYNLIILDLMLPGIDGLEVCRKLRASSKYSLVVSAQKTVLLPT